MILSYSSKLRIHLLQELHVPLLYIPVFEALHILTLCYTCAHFMIYINEEKLGSKFFQSAMPSGMYTAK